MNEADIPIHQHNYQPTDLNQVNVPPEVTDPAQLSQEKPGAAEGWETVNLPNTINIDAIAQGNLDEEEVLNSSITFEQKSLGTAPRESVFSPNLILNSDTIGATVGKELMAIVQDLRQSNSNLLQRVAQLEKSLDQNQKTLQQQQQRNQAQETLLGQKTQELSQATSEITRLNQEVESVRQNNQRQQILLQTLTEELESSQERVAQLERECALTQQRYNEQTHLLSQAENTARDLRSRLNRQQRHTLQFKAALEKCLELPSPYGQNPVGKNEVSTQKNKEDLVSDPTPVARPFLPRSQPVRPWSAEPGEPVMDETIIINENNDNPSADSIPEVVQPSDTKVTLDTVAVVAPTNHPDISAPTQTRETSINDETLWQDLTKLVDQDLARAETIKQETVKKIEPALPPLVQRDELPKTSINIEQINPLSGIGSELNISQSKIELPSAIDEQSSQVMQKPPDSLPKLNWPAPIVYPLHPVKKRKSLAAIELPSFPTKTIPGKEINKEK